MVPFSSYYYDLPIVKKQSIPTIKKIFSVIGGLDLASMHLKLMNKSSKQVNIMLYIIRVYSNYVNVKKEKSKGRINLGTNSLSMRMRYILWQTSEGVYLFFTSYIKVYCVLIYFLFK